MIGNADKFFRHLGNDFFPCQGAAAALDQVQVAGCFVCTVHIQRQSPDLSRVENLYAVSTQAFGGGFGTGYSAVYFALDCGERINEKVGCRAGTDANDIPDLDVLDGGLGDGFFQLIWL